MKNSFRLIKYFPHLTSFNYILHFVVDAVVCPVPVMLEPCSWKCADSEGMSLPPSPYCVCACARAHAHVCVFSDSMQSAVLFIGHSDMPF